MPWMNTDDAAASGMPFSDSLVNLLTAARREAEALSHDYVGSEHVVLALASDDAGGWLATLGIDSNRVRLVASSCVVRGRSSPIPGTTDNKPYTSRTIAAFNVAADSARRRGEPSIRVKDVLVGLMRERLNVGAEILRLSGLTLERAEAHAGESAA